MNSLIIEVSDSEATANPAAVVAAAAVGQNPLPPPRTAKQRRRGKTKQRERNQPNRGGQPDHSEPHPFTELRAGFIWADPSDQQWEVHDPQPWFIDCIARLLMEEARNVVILSVDPALRAVFRPIGPFMHDRRTTVVTMMGFVTVHRFHKHGDVSKVLCKGRPFVHPLGELEAHLGNLCFPEGCPGTCDDGSDALPQHEFLHDIYGPDTFWGQPNDAPKIDNFQLIVDEASVRKAIMMEESLVMSEVACREAIFGEEVVDLDPIVEVCAITRFGPAADELFLDSLVPFSELCREEDRCWEELAKALDPSSGYSATGDGTFGYEAPSSLRAYRHSAGIHAEWQAVMDAGVEAGCGTCFLAVTRMLSLDSVASALWTSVQQLTGPKPVPNPVVVRGTDRLAIPEMGPLCAYRPEDPTVFGNSEDPLCSCITYPSCHHCRRGSTTLIVDGVPTIGELALSRTCLVRTSADGYRVVEGHGADVVINVGAGVITGWRDSFLPLGRVVPSRYFVYEGVRYSSFPRLADTARGYLAGSVFGASLTVSGVLTAMTGGFFCLLKSPVIAKLLLACGLSLNPVAHVAAGVCVAQTLVAALYARYRFMQVVKQPITNVVDFLIERPNVRKMAKKLVPEQDVAVDTCVTSTLLQRHGGVILAQKLARLVKLDAVDGMNQHKVLDVISMTDATAASNEKAMVFVPTA